MSKKNKVAKKEKEKPAPHLETVINLDSVRWAAGRGRHSYNDEDNITFLKDSMALTTEQLIEKYGLKKSSLYSRLSNLRKRLLEKVQGGDQALLERLQAEGLLINKV